MSDFVFIRAANTVGSVESQLQAAEAGLAALPPDVTSVIHGFCGDWGALAVREGHYAGFSPFESKQHVIVVVGGPVLRFRDNSYLSSAGSADACVSILQRWLDGKLDPVADLDGPFAILIIDKTSGMIHCITDLMLFIPLFAYQAEHGLIIGSHIDVTGDALARMVEHGETLDRWAFIDEPAFADFCLHGAVCYPFTLYKGLFQLPPAHELRFSGENPENLGSSANQTAQQIGFESHGRSYWLPKRTMKFNDIDAASRYVRTGVEAYIQAVLDGVADSEGRRDIAQFISAGEDSRVIAGLLRARVNDPIEAQVYTDSYNKELKIAERAAGYYDLKFHPVIRDPNHYFAIMPQATRLTGSQFQYHHSHPFNVQPANVLLNFKAVFGGFSADVMLKGQYAPKNRHVERLRFLPDIETAPATQNIQVRSSLFSATLLEEVARRRNMHLSRVKALRDSDHLEWYSIWPATMRKALPNLLANRRLFRSYEPFVSNTAVLAAANIPTRWRLNRRVFRKAFHADLHRSKFLRHADGRLPYFPWWVSIPGYMLESYRKAWVRRFDKQRPAEGPWCNWRRLQSTEAWNTKMTAAEKLFKSHGILSKNARLSTQGHEQQLNVMQLKEILANHNLSMNEGQAHE